MTASPRQDGEPAASGSARADSRLPKLGDRTTTVVLVLALAVCAAGWVRAQRVNDLQRYYWKRDHPLMLLPSGEYLKASSLGYETVMADMIYLWSIQYYARTTPEGRRYMWHIYDVVTDLDPRYLDAYSTGAMVMAIQMRDPAMALRLLDKGIDNNPDEWMLRLEAGFYAYQYLKDYERAVRYFEDAMAIPDAPAHVARLRAGMYEYAGDLERALQFWWDVYEGADSKRIEDIAWQHVYDLQVTLDVRHLQAVAERFQKERGRLPMSLEELVRRGYLEAVPTNPDGEPYLWDPDAGEVIDPGAERPRSRR